MTIRLLEGEQRCRFALGHNFGSRLGRPIERMRLNIPFGDICHKPLGQVIQGSEVAEAQSLALENAKPLLHLVHPGAMRWQEVADEAWVSCQPSLNLLASMDAGVIEHQENVPNRGFDLPIEPSEHGDEFGLAFASRRSSRDLARSCVKSRKQMQGSGTLVLVLHTGWQPWARRFGWGQTRAWLQIGLLIDTQDSLPVSKGAGVELN